MPATCSQAGMLAAAIMSEIADAVRNATREMGHLEQTFARIIQYKLVNV